MSQPLPQPEPEDVRIVGEPGTQPHELLTRSDEEVGGNPKHLKSPRCGETPLHYELHMKYCNVVRK
jgi:hypothetical protein